VDGIAAMKYKDSSCQCDLPYAIDQQGCQYFFHEEDGSSNWISDTCGFSMMHFEYPKKHKNKIKCKITQHVLL